MKLYDNHIEAAGSGMLFGGAGVALNTVNTVVQTIAGIVAIIGGVLLVYRFFKPHQDPRVDEILQRLEEQKHRIDDIEDKE